ncbi:MAG: hypothetical protein ACT4PV_12400, partial [Planctomycetaceae bacterium]
LLVGGVTFVGAAGVGVYVGTLAGGAPPPPPDLDRRVEDFRRAYGLDPVQSRRVRELLAEHDREVAEVRTRITGEQQREIDAIHDRWRSRILSLLEPGQRRN